MSKEAFEVLLQPLFTASAYSRAAFPKNLIMLFGEVPRTTQEMRLLAMVMRLLTSMLVGNLWAILEKVMQLCSWVPGRRLREMARVRPGFSLPFRAAHSQPKGQPAGRLCRCSRREDFSSSSAGSGARVWLASQGDRRSGCAGVGVSRRKQWLTARLCLSKGGDASSGVRAKNMPLHLGDTGWKPAGTPCARSAPPATPASLTAGTNTSSRSPRLKHRHVHPPWPPLPLVPPAQAPSEKAPLTPEPAGPALCQGLEAAPPG
ncbi:uncharacterized protein LOC122153156 isoform X3 [Tyto alba]|uniref:uncharacterized protein LOC122153156 isoform X3 n=1 Tax=Tyto alba TaxID=56313 RepID=UPI001C67AA75|nr:uncharacterized protein LOC122153156 isoform X3 [Tyto alba]